MHLKYLSKYEAHRQFISQYIGFICFKITNLYVTTVKKSFEPHDMYVNYVFSS